MWICQRSQSQPRDVIESIFYHHPSRTVTFSPATSFRNAISAFSPIHHQLHPIISIPCRSQLFSTIIILPLVSANVDSLSIPVWRHLPGPQSRHRCFSKSKKCNSSSFPCPVPSFVPSSKMIHIDFSEAHPVKVQPQTSLTTQAPEARSQTSIQLSSHFWSFISGCCDPKVNQQISPFCL